MNFTQGACGIRETTRPHKENIMKIELAPVIGPEIEEVIELGITNDENGIFISINTEDQTAFVEAITLKRGLESTPVSCDSELFKTAEKFVNECVASLSYEEQANDSEVTKPETKYPEKTIRAIAERCWWHKSTTESLARHFDMDEADIVEIRKSKAYLDAIAKLMLSKDFQDSLPAEIARIKKLN